MANLFDIKRAAVHHSHPAEPLAKIADEIGVIFDKKQVFRLDAVVEQGLGEDSRSGAQFDDHTVAAWVDVLHHCVGEKGSTREDGSRGARATADIAQKREDAAGVMIEHGLHELTGLSYGGKNFFLYTSSGRGMTRTMMTKSQKKGTGSARPVSGSPHPSAGREAEWFGYEKVSPQEKTAKVGEVFHSVAPSYDLMNDLMSGGVHRLWKRRFVASVHPEPEEVILDVAGGTGDIAFLMHKACPDAHITLCDINESMLRVGRDRGYNRGMAKGFRYVVGNAECLPIESNSVDVYTISFGLRNVTDIDAALREANRVLKPNGRFFCLEFSRMTFAPLRPLYDLYSFAVLPFLGRHVARDAASYQYLAESIRQFPPQEELLERMHEAGLQKGRYTNLSGGLVAIHAAIKG